MTYFSLGMFEHVPGATAAHGVVQGAGDSVDSGVAVPVRRTNRMAA
jgi:hypothetical protein